MDSNKIKKGLGRGLSSLIGETKVETPKNQLSISDDKPLPRPFLILSIKQHSQLLTLDL